MITVYTTHYNRLEFLSLQYEKLKEHCIDDFKYIVINNGIDVDTKNKISEYCLINNIEEIIINQEEQRHGYCSYDHIIALDYVYKQYIAKDISDIRVVMDNDVIPYKNFSFITILNNHDVAGFYQQSMIDYSSAIFTMYDKNVNLEGFEIDGKFGDSGSGTGNLIRGNKYSINWVDVTCPMRELESTYIFSQTNPGALLYDATWGIQFISSCFIHYYRGTGWDNGDPNYYNDKLNFFKHFINNSDIYNPKLDSHSHYPKAHVDCWLWLNDYKLNKLL